MKARFIHALAILLAACLAGEPVTASAPLTRSAGPAAPVNAPVYREAALSFSGVARYVGARFFNPQGAFWTARRIQRRKWKRRMTKLALQVLAVTGVIGMAGGTDHAMEEEENQALLMAQREQALKYFHRTPVFVSNRQWKEFNDDVNAIFTLMRPFLYRDFMLVAVRDALLDYSQALQALETERALTRVELLELISRIDRLMAVLGTYRVRLFPRTSLSQEDAQRLIDRLSTVHRRAFFAALPDMYSYAFRRAPSQVVIGAIDSQNRLFLPTASPGFLRRVGDPKHTLCLFNVAQMGDIRLLTLPDNALGGDANDVMVLRTAKLDRPSFGVSIHGLIGVLDYHEPEYSNVRQSAEEAALRETFGMIERGQPVLDAIVLKEGETAVLVDTPLMSLFALRGAAVLYVSSDPEMIGDARHYHSLPLGLLRVGGGTIQFIEGQLDDSKVRAYIQALGGADHLVSLHTSVSPTTLAALKRPDYGTIYIGPLAPSEYTALETALKHEGMRITEMRTESAARGAEDFELLGDLKARLYRVALPPGSGASMAFDRVVPGLLFLVAPFFLAFKGGSSLLTALTAALFLASALAGLFHLATSAGRSYRPVAQTSA